MPEVPLSIYGVTRQVWVESLTEDTWQKELHQYRREGVIKRRMYYERTQYEGENLEKKLEVFAGQPFEDQISRPLPEHQRKHSYATQIAEGIDFIADQIAGAMRVEATDEKVQAWLGAQFQKSRMKHRWQEIIREAEIAGDVFSRIVPKRGFEGDEPACRIEFWQAEDVEADYSEDDWSELVEIRWEEFRTEVNANGDKEEVRYVHKVNLQGVSGPPIEIAREAVESVYRGDLAEPISVRRLGLPFIPWVHVSGENLQLRSMWGRPVITTNVMETVDRYNAVCQLEFLAARYNSFSHLAVVGDAAALKLYDEATTVESDIADVLTFPGGTEVTTVTLPTDTALLNSQKQTLKAAMFEAMGLEQIDADALHGLGQLSGYALEILNRKTDATFKALVENIDEGIRHLIEMGLLVDAYVRQSVLVELPDEAGMSDVAWNWWEVDPDTVWPDRKVELRFGSVYIVDEVANRDDYVAGIISRKEALRKKGMTDDEIDGIEGEIAEEKSGEESRLAASLEQGTRLSTERG